MSKLSELAIWLLFLGIYGSLGAFVVHYFCVTRTFTALVTVEAEDNPKPTALMWSRPGG